MISFNTQRHAVIGHMKLTAWPFLVYIIFSICTVAYDVLLFRVPIWSVEAGLHGS